MNINTINRLHRLSKQIDQIKVEILEILNQEAHGLDWAPLQCQLKKHEP